MPHRLEQLIVIAYTLTTAEKFSWHGVKLLLPQINQSINENKNIYVAIKNWQEAIFSTELKVMTGKKEKKTIEQSRVRDREGAGGWGLW